MLLQIGYFRCCVVSQAFAFGDVARHLMDFRTFKHPFAINERRFLSPHPLFQIACGVIDQIIGLFEQQIFFVNNACRMQNAITRRTHFAQPQAAAANIKRWRIRAQLVLNLAEFLIAGGADGVEKGQHNAAH